MIEEALYQPTPRQLLQYDLTEAIVNQYGQFDQSAKSEGAHYAPSVISSLGMIQSLQTALGSMSPETTSHARGPSKK